MKNLSKKIIIIALSGLLCACGLFDKDNTPPPNKLVNFTPEAIVNRIWSVNTGSGVGKDYLKLPATMNQPWLFTTHKNGVVTANEKTSGHRVWEVNTRSELTTGATVDQNALFIGTRDGELLALDQANGRTLWRAKVATEILATPAAKHGIVIAKTINGRISALDETTGHVLWNYQQTEPALILRGSSAPQISDNIVVAGFANGNLAKLTLRNGSLLWSQVIAYPEGSFAIQRMIDIDADPIIYDNHVYVATYQGRIAALDLSNGHPIWVHDLSSYSGITADHEHVYVSDAKSHIWAIDNATGSVAWRQTDLEARNITGPVNMGRYLVVGDAEGYLHWLSKRDGHFIARTKVDGSGILATPVIENNALYVVSRNGRLSAYTIS